MARVMLLHGGWPGHQPMEMADLVADSLLREHEVVRVDTLDVLAPDILSGFDLLIPIWTYGELSTQQEKALVDAVENGMGIVAWHGAASAFIANRAYKFLLGGQFVGHPGGDMVRYSVKFRDAEPLCAGLPEVDITSEQYYLLVDPSVTVLATTEMDGADKDWLAGVSMPVAWKRNWGKGRVFYCALGHRKEDIEHPVVAELLRRALAWAIGDPCPHSAMSLQQIGRLPLSPTNADGLASNQFV